MHFWLVSGSILGAFWCQGVAKILLKIQVQLLSRGDTAAPLRTLATSELVFGADTGRCWQLLAVID